MSVLKHFIYFERQNRLASKLSQLTDVFLKHLDTYHFESVKPQLCQFFQRFDLPTSHGEIGEYLTPEISRLTENLSGLLFPLLLLCLLSGYRRFSSTPDPHDLSLDEDGVRAESEPPHHVTRLR